MTEERKNTLLRIEKGMEVYSSDDHDIGTVEHFHFPEGSGAGMSSAAPPDQPVRPDFADMLKNLFSQDSLPEEVRERLTMHGFIRVDSPVLFAHDRYIMLDDVESVGNGRVFLKLTRDQLKGKNG